MERLQISELVQACPELFWLVDFCDPDSGCLGTRFEYPRWWHTCHIFTDLIVVQDGDKVGYRDAVFLCFETHRQFIPEVTNRRIAHTEYTQMFAQGCRRPYVIIVQANDALDGVRACEKTDAFNHIIHFSKVR